MLYIVLSIIVCEIYGFINLGFDFLIFIMMGLLGILIGILIYSVSSALLDGKFPKEETVRKKEIYALTDSTSLHGSFYLWSGTIDTKNVIRYVINTEKGKHIEETDAEKSYIVEIEGEPYVEEHVFTWKKDWYSWFVFGASMDNYKKFFVPPNTITTEFNIDLK